MRNLKRALSLAMASVMLLGMMVVGTSASYADVDSKDNIEAIEIMQAAGIMSGDPQGNFNPDQSVTRNEMAVVMVNLLGLNKDDFTAISIPFTDVPDWARNYVAACYANGIVAGTSATTYGGDETVTTAQASLMMLKALGYFKYQSDFGNNWQVATVSQAAKINLVKDITTGANAAMDRNNVAQLALNALKSNVVEPSGTPGTEIDTGDTSITIGNTVKYDPIVSSTYNYNYAASNTDDYRYQQLAEKLFGNDLRVNTNNQDNFGRPANRWTFKAKEVGAYAKEATVTYTDTVKSSQIYSDLGLGANKTASYTVDGTATGSFLIAKGNSTKTNTITNVGTGTSIEVYYDVDNDTVDIAFINTYVGTVSNVYPEADTPYITITGITGVSGDFEATGYAVDDVVLYTYDGNEIQSVAKAQKVEGVEVTAYTTDKVTAGGTTYTYNVKSVDDTALAVENSYDLYLDANGYVVYTELYEGSNDYAYVMQATNTPVSGITSDTWTVKLAFADGTVATVQTDYDLGNPQNTWVSYTVENGVYSIYPKTTDQGTGNFRIESGKSAITVDGATYYANDNTVLVVKEALSNNYKAYVGIKNFPTIERSGAAFSPADAAVQYGTGNIAKYVFVETASSDVSDSTNGIIYVIESSMSKQTTDSNGTYYTYNAVVDNTITTINVSTGYTGNGFTAGELAADAKLGSLSYNSKGLVTGATPYSLGTGESTVSNTGTERYKDGTIGLYNGSGYTRYTAAEDVKVYVISDDKFTESSFTAVGTDSDDTFYALLKDGQVKALFITKMNVATPVLSASISGGNTITVTVSNNSTAGTMALSCTVTGGATASVTDNVESAGTGTITLTGTTGTTGYVTVKVINTVPNVGSAYAEYVVSYTLP